MLGNNGMQTHTKSEDNKTPHWVNEEAAREIIMQSDNIVQSEHCMALFVLMVMCGSACLWFAFCIRVSLALTVSGTFPYAEKKAGEIRTHSEAFVNCF